MQYFTLAAAAIFSAVAVASPASVTDLLSLGSGANTFKACTEKTLFTFPLCCTTDILGVADLACSTPKNVKNNTDFSTQCNAVGKSPQCCVISLLGQAVLCEGSSGSDALSATVNSKKSS